MHCLFFGRFSLDQLDPFFSTTFDSFVKSFCVTPQPSKTVQKTIFIGEQILLILIVAISFCCLDPVVKNSDLVSIQDFNTTLWEVRQLLIWEVRFLVFEKSKTFTNAETLRFFIATATLRALYLCLVNGVGELKRLFAIVNIVLHRRFYVRIVHNVTGAVEQHPSC